MHRVSYGFRSSSHYNGYSNSGSSISTSRSTTSRTGLTHHRYRRRQRYSLPTSGCGSYRDSRRGVNYHIYNRANNNNDDQTSISGARDAVPTRKPDFSNVLVVKDVDLNVAENGRAHHTDEYEISNRWQRSPKLVVRRGQPFTMELSLSREFNTAKDDLKLVFETGDEPSSINGTQVELILSDDDLPKQWGAKVVSKKGSQLTVQIFTPPDLYVGKWDLSVEVVKADDTDVDIYQYEHDDPIYVIFNPWNKDDSVYVSDKSLLEEYVLNESGYLYVGTQHTISEKPWNFGQFDSCILDCALSLLDESDIKWEVRNSPINVVRKLSALINCQDDSGVLVGKWDGNYGDGRSPCSWTGSVKILEKYHRTKRPVKYGQCWVFSGISTTICRALGIPARSVTNFESAHDTDGSVTIDTILDADGNKEKEASKDSVWNFHVWNEAWMARPDLPKAYGGWQAFDATPQETSDGIYCCGPASVEAVKQGEIHLPYDGSFLFAEVNADRWTWQTNRRGKLECIDRKKHDIGKNISTKAANGSHREDLTLQYKPREGTAEERAAVLKANQTGSSRPGLYKENDTKAKDVKFTIEQEPTKSWLGDAFEVILHMRNTSSAPRTVSGRMVLSTQYYTGQLANTLKNQSLGNVTLRPGQETDVVVTVEYDEYDGKLKDCCMLDLSVFAHVQQTDQRFSEKKSYRLRKPHLTLKAPRESVVGQEFTVEASFSNPLACVLTGCFVEVDGLARPLKFRLGNVASRGTLVTDLPIIPKRPGKKDLIVIFNSDQLEDINTSVPISVLDD